MECPGDTGPSTYLHRVEGLRCQTSPALWPESRDCAQMTLAYLETGIPPFDPHLLYEEAQFHTYETAAMESARLQVIDQIRGGQVCERSVKLPHGPVHA